MPNYRQHRTHLETIFHAALKAADPAGAVRRHWRPDEIEGAERVFIVGAGKAGLAMGETVAELAGEQLTGGVVAVPASPPTGSEATKLSVQAEQRKVRYIPAGHPQPNAGSLAAGAAIADLLSGATERDRVIAVISGGGSALLEKLGPGFGLEELQSLNAKLLRCGAPIQEINCVRKHLSFIKGGGLARLAWPARLVALILSDVMGDSLDVIASGPTAPDPTHLDEAKAILQKYDLAAEGVVAALHETPKPGDRLFERVVNRLIGSNTLARQAAAEAARALGFEVHLPPVAVEGEAREWALTALALASEIANTPGGGRSASIASAHPPVPERSGVGCRTMTARSAEPGVRRPLAILFGGETTVTVRGTGLGGRNQELALAAALALDGRPELIAMASAGTDGVDGFSPAAGAFATPETCSRARALGLDPAASLANNDSYSFFKALGDCLVTGPTGTNVNDLVIVLIY